MSKSEIQTVKFKGLVKWASVPPNPARKPPTDYINPLAPNDSFYSVEVECSKDKFKKLIEAGIPKLSALKTDEATGKTYIRVKAAKVRRVNGEDITFSDPFVLDASGEAFKEAIGNGSEAIVLADLVSVKRGKVLRLRGVQVLNHITYTPKSGGADIYKDQLEIASPPTTTTKGAVGENLEDFL